MNHWKNIRETLLNIFFILFTEKIKDNDTETTSSSSPGYHATYAEAVASTNTPTTTSTTSTGVVATGDESEILTLSTISQGTFTCENILLRP